MKEATPTQIAAVELVTDYIKHLTTLSTGSLVLLATFIDKFTGATWTFAAVVAVTGFIVCIMGCLVANGTLVFRAEQGDFTETTGVAEKLEGVALLISFGSFLVALISLAVFAIRNLV